MDYETILENFQEDTSDKYATRMIEEGMNHPFDKVYEDAQIESINSIKDAFLRNKYSDLFKFTLETDISEEIPTIVPNIFPDELSDLGVLDPDNTQGDISDPSFNITPFIDSYEYKTKVEKLYSELQENKKDKSIIRKLIEMGWNPEVEPNEKNFKIARRNMITYMKHKLESIDIINLSKYDSDIGSVSLNETTYFDEEIHPVFVVCSYTYTNFGKLVRKITGATYSHASIGFDSGLQTLYSYNMNSNVKKHGGLSFESINEYIRVNKDAEIFVGVVFLDHYDYDKMRGNVNWYITNYHKSNYSIANLFRILVNKSKTKRYQMNMVCSQFVDNCFKLVNIDLTNKASNLTTPQDLSNSVDNKKVFILYDGLARDYDMKKIDKKIYSLINKIKMDAILKKNDVEAVLASTTFQELEENSNYFRNLEIIPLFENYMDKVYDPRYKSNLEHAKKYLSTHDRYSSIETFCKDTAKIVNGSEFITALVIYMTNYGMITQYNVYSYIKMNNDPNGIMLVSFSCNGVGGDRGINTNKTSNILSFTKNIEIINMKRIDVTGHDMKTFYDIMHMFKANEKLEKYNFRINFKKDRATIRIPSLPRFKSDLEKVASKYPQVKINKTNTKISIPKLNSANESVEIFSERVFPIIVNDDYITINTIEDMESQYQKAHKLLISYDKAGTYDKPMKSELARLWFINACIESKLKKKKDQNLINLRSRVLNDFKKYLNKVMENDPTFDFTDYYTGSMYADNNIKIDKTLLKNLLSILKV